MADRKVTLTSDAYTKVSANNATSVDLKVPRVGFGATGEDAVAFLKSDDDPLTGSLADQDELATIIDGSVNQTNAILGIDVTDTALWCRWAGSPNRTAAEKYVIVAP